MSAVLTLAAKDLRLLWRDRAGLFWVLGFPLAVAILFGAIFGGSGGWGAGAMPVALVDEAATEASRAFAARLARSDALEVRAMGREEALAAVRRGRLVAYVVLEKGFGEGGADPFGGGQPMELGIDPSRRAEAGWLTGILTQASFEGMQELFTDPAKSRAKVQEGLRDLDAAGEGGGLAPEQRGALRGFLGSLDEYLGKVDPDLFRQGPAASGPSIRQVSVAEESAGPRSAYEVSFPQATVWALIGTVATFAITLVRERAGGTWLRLRLSPVGRARLLAGKGLACFAACVLTVALVLLLGVLVFGVRVGSAAGIAAAVACAALGFTGIMMLVSTLGRSEQAVAGAGWAILLVMSMLGGGMVPLFLMPGWMRAVATLSPVKWAILGLEGAIWRGFTAAEMALPCGVLLAVGAVCFAAGVWNLSRAER
jgi:ABC-2 type transport system permease protein